MDSDLSCLSTPDQSCLKLEFLCYEEKLSVCIIQCLSVTFIILAFTSANLNLVHFIYLFIWGFRVTFNTVQVISRQVVGRAEETSTYSWSKFCTLNCRPMACNYQLSLFGPGPGLRRGRREVTTLPPWPLKPCARPPSDVCVKPLCVNKHVDMP